MVKTPDEFIVFHRFMEKIRHIYICVVSTVKCQIDFFIFLRDFLKIIHLYRRVADVEKFMEKLL